MLGRHFTRNVNVPQSESKYFFALPLCQHMPYTFESTHGTVSFELVVFWRFLDGFWRIATKPLVIKSPLASSHFSAILMAQRTSFRAQKSSTSFFARLSRRNHQPSIPAGGTSSDSTGLISANDPHKIQLSFSLHNHKFTFGSNLPFSLTLTNFHSIQHFKVDVVTVSLVRRTTYYGDSATKATYMVMDQVSLNDSDLKAMLFNPRNKNYANCTTRDPHSAAISWWGKLKVPDDMPQSFAVASSGVIPSRDIIKMEYILKVRKKCYLGETESFDIR